ncbi:MAG: recombinase family protein [Lysinibacillus sp.]
MDEQTIIDLYKGKIAIYCRVSTAGQNIGQQIALAELYCAQNGIENNNVHYYLDDNISANKLSIDQRPNLNQLLIDIRSRKIKTVIVQSRDRLARNFYQYIDIVREFYKYNVQVIFTDVGQAAFSKTLSIEALYGIFAQSEGRNIANRTSLAAARFPNAIWGFDIVGKRSEKKYIPSAEKAAIIQSLFKSVLTIQTAEELFVWLTAHKKWLKNDLKLLACLNNPFYTGYIKMEDQYVKLQHVESIISLDDFRRVQEHLAQFQLEITQFIKEMNEKSILHPICSVCKTPMSLRNREYICAKKGHPRKAIEVRNLNQYVKEHLTYVLQHIDIEKVKKSVLSQLLCEEKQVNNELLLKDNQQKALHKKIALSLGTSSKTKMSALLEQSELLKDEMVQLHTRLMKIAAARKDMQAFAKVVRTHLIDELNNYNQEYLIRMLIAKIEISSGNIIYHTNFGHYIAEEGVKNEA